jgi:hypothetical protein
MNRRSPHKPPVLAASENPRLCYINVRAMAKGSVFVTAASPPANTDLRVQYAQAVNDNCYLGPTATRLWEIAYLNPGGTKIAGEEIARLLGVHLRHKRLYRAIRELRAEHYLYSMQNPVKNNRGGAIIHIIFPHPIENLSRSELWGIIDQSTFEVSRKNHQKPLVNTGLPTDSTNYKIKSENNEMGKPKKQGKNGLFFLKTPEKIGGVFKNLEKISLKQVKLVKLNLAKPTVKLSLLQSTNVLFIKNNLTRVATRSINFSKTDLVGFDSSTRLAQTKLNQINPSSIRLTEDGNHETIKALLGRSTRHPAINFHGGPVNPPGFCQHPPYPATPLAKNHPTASERRFYGKKGYSIDMKKIQSDDTRTRLIAHWNGLAKTHHFPRLRVSTDSDNFLRARGRLNQALKKHTESEIAAAMDTYASLFEGTYPTIPPHEKKAPWRVGLSEFFKWTDYGYIKKETDGKVARVCPRKEKNCSLRNAESWFIECLKGSGYVKSAHTRVKKDPHEAATGIMRSCIKDSQVFLYGDLNAPYEKNILIKAAGKLKDFVEQRKKYLDFQDGNIQRLREVKSTEILVKYFTGIGRSDIPIEWLVTNITYKKFEAYLIQTAYLSEEWLVERTRTRVKESRGRNA